MVAFGHHSALLSSGHYSTSDRTTDSVFYKPRSASWVAKDDGATLWLHVALFNRHFAFFNVDGKLVLTRKEVWVSSSVSVVKPCMSNCGRLAIVSIVAVISLATSSARRSVLFFILLIRNLSTCRQWISFSRIDSADCEAFNQASFSLSSTGDNVIMAGSEFNESVWHNRKLLFNDKTLWIDAFVHNHLVSVLSCVDRVLNPLEAVQAEVVDLEDLTFVLGF
jgi:hypothetical protein